MRRLVVLAAALAALAALAGAVPTRAADDPPVTRPTAPERAGTVQRGSELFAANCATCHGSRGRGVVPGRGEGASDIQGAGPSLVGVGARAADFYLTTGYMPLGDPDDQPQRRRPAFARPEVEALTQYVASLGKGPGLPSTRAAGDVARGMESFTEHCAGCHQVVGSGGIVTGARVPPLKDATPRQIREAVRIGPYVMPRFSARAIGERELDDIVAYVRYAQHPRDAGGWGIDHLGPFPEGLVTWFIAMVVLVATCVVIGSRTRRA